MQHTSKRMAYVDMEGHTYRAAWRTASTAYASWTRCTRWECRSMHAAVLSCWRAKRLSVSSADNLQAYITFPVVNKRHQYTNEYCEDERAPQVLEQYIVIGNHGTHPATAASRAVVWNLSALVANEGPSAAGTNMPSVCCFQ